MEPKQRWKVTETFTDWDDQTIKAGTIVDFVVERGKVPGRPPFYNLITCNRVVAVTQGVPPVEAVSF